MSDDEGGLILPVPTLKHKELKHQITIDSNDSPLDNILSKRRRKQAIGGGGGGGKLKEIEESPHEAEKGKVFLKLMQSDKKRLSLTPETKHRERPGLQSSHSVELGSLPTWRGKAFLTLQNYWTGDQHSDRLHNQGAQVSDYIHNP